MVFNIFNKPNKKEEDKNIIINRKPNIKASIIGFIVGDTLGVPVEFLGRETLKSNPITKMEEFGTHNQPIGTWSDDSSMVIATIDSMINTKYRVSSIDATVNTKSIALTELCKNTMDAFYEWKYNAKYTPFGKVFDIGNATRYAIDNYENKISRIKGAVNDEKELKQLIECGSGDISSNGNGSLMRILPASIYAYYLIKDEKEFNSYIYMVSALTHSHVISQISCLIYSKYVGYLLDGYDKYKAYLKLKEWFKEPVQSNPKYSSEDIKIFKRILQGDISKLSEKEIKSSGYVLDSLEATLWVILTTNNYKDAVLKAVNLGDDTDTIGALTGGLAGLIYGYDSIPSEWIDVLQKKEYILELINKFADGFKDIKKDDKNNMKKEIATKDSWTTLPMSDKFEDIELDIHLNEEELEIVKRGHIPEVMEDHWFMYYENGKLYIHRSWTGFCCFIVDVPENGYITHAIATRDEKYRSRGIEDDKKIINDLIRNHIKYYNVELEPSFRLVEPEEVEQILLNKNKDDAMKIINKVIEDDNDEFLNKQVPEIVKKIKDMPYSVETTIAKLINYDPVNIFVSPLMQGKILNAVKDTCKKNNIYIEEIRREERFTGLPYYIPFMKIEKTNGLDNDNEDNGEINIIKNDLILKVEHIPFHGTYGRIDELKRPESIIDNYELSENTTIDLTDFKIKILKINDDYVDLKIYDNKGILSFENDFNFVVDFKNGDSEGKVKVNDTLKLYKFVFDASESWNITLLKKQNSNIEKIELPKVKNVGEVREYYIDEVGHERERIKTVEIPNVIIPKELENKIDLNRPIIMFKIEAGNKVYQLHFGTHDKKGLLDYSNSDDPQDLYYCNLSEYMFNNFRDKIYSLTENWKNKYYGDNNLKIKWSLKEITGDKLTKNYVGENDYPDNWNEFIDYIKLFEKICKQNSSNKK